MNARGFVEVRRNGLVILQRPNLITAEGLDYLIDNEVVAASLAPGDPAIYVAPFTDDVPVAANWTGASFASDANENTSTTDGYEETTRPLWVPTDNGTNVSNDLNPAEFNIRTTGSPIQLCGFGLVVGDDVRGGTTGTLLAAVRFSDAPVLFDDHDILDLRWILTITA